MTTDEYKEIEKMSVNDYLFYGRKLKTYHINRKMIHIMGYMRIRKS